LVIFGVKSPRNKLVGRVDETLPWIEKKTGKMIQFINGCMIANVQNMMLTFMSNTVPIFLIVIIAVVRV
jgi:hypothetical protein